MEDMKNYAYTLFRTIPCPHPSAGYDVFSCTTRVAKAVMVWPYVRMSYCLMS